MCRPPSRVAVDALEQTIRNHGTTTTLALLRPFPYLGSAHRVSSFRTSLHVSFRSSYLSVSTHFHVLITTSSSVFLSTWPNHLSLASLIFSLIPIILLKILISVLSRTSSSAFLSAQVSLPYIITGLMTVLLYCCFEHMAILLRTLFLTLPALHRRFFSCLDNLVL